MRGLLMKKTILRVLAVLALLLCSHAPSLAANSVYISQSGGGTGASCASPLAASYFNTSGNWSATPTGTQIGPGTTVFLCGVITTNLTFQGNGSVGGSSTCGYAATACTPVILDGSQSGAFMDAYIDTGRQYWVIQNITWGDGVTGSGDGPGLSNGAYATNSSTQAVIQTQNGAAFGTIQGNHMDVMNSAQNIFFHGTTHDIAILNNFLRIGTGTGGSYPFYTGGDGFDTDGIDTEGGYNVLVQGNYIEMNTGAGDSSCGGCHNDLTQVWGSVGSTHDWRYLYNYWVQNSSPSITNNLSWTIIEQVSQSTAGVWDFIGNVFLYLSGGNSGNGMVFDGNFAGMTAHIYGNTMVGKSGSGNNLLNLSGSGSYNLEDNIIYSTTQGNALTGGVTFATRGYNLWFGGPSPSCVATELCGQDPLFTNYASNNFTLQSGSPARSLGTNLGTSYNGYALPTATWPNPALGTRPGGSTAWDSGYTQFTGGGSAPNVTNLQVPTATKSITLTNANFNGNLTGWSPASCATYDGTKTHTADGSGSAKLVSCGSGTVTVLTSPTLIVDQTFSSLFIKSYIMADNAFNGTITFGLQDITHGNTILNTTRGRNAKQIGPATGATTAWVLAQSEQLLNTYMHGGDKVQFSIKVTGQTAGTLWIDDLAFQEAYYPLDTFVTYPNYRGYLYAAPDPQTITGVTEFSPFNSSQSGLTIQLATAQYCASGIVQTITPTITLPVTAWSMAISGLTINQPYYLCTSATINGNAVTYDYPADYTITPVSQTFKAALVNTFNTTSNAWEHNFGSGLVNTLLLGAYDSWSGANRTGSFGTGLFSSGGQCSPAQSTATLCYELNVNGMGTATPLSAPPVGLTGGVHGSALFTDYKAVNYNSILNFNAMSGVNPTTGADQLTPYLSAMSANSMTHIQLQNNYFGGLITGTILPGFPASPTVTGTSGGSLSTAGGANLYIKIAEVGMEVDAEPNLDYLKTQASATTTLAIGSSTAAVITLPTCDVGGSGWFIYAAQGATQPSETAFRRQFDDPYFPCSTSQVTLTTLIDSGDRTNSWDISSVTRAGSTVTVNIVQPTQTSCSANQYYIACILSNAEFTLSGITSSPNNDFNGACVSVTVVTTTQFTCSLPGSDTSGTGGLAQADETRSFVTPTWFTRTTTDSSSWTTLGSRMTGNAGAAFEAPCDECFALAQDRVYKQKTFWQPAADDIPTFSYLFPYMLSFTGVREEADVIGADPYGYGFAGASDARWALPAGDRSCTLYNTSNTTHTVAQCDVNLVDIWSEAITRATYGSRPVVIIPQEWENGGFNGGTYAEMRLQAYKALLGCQIFGNLGCGVMWWQHGEESGMEDMYYRLGNTSAYTDLTTIDAEISGLSSVWLSPTLDSSAPILTGFHDPGTGTIVSGVQMNSAPVTQAATNTVCGFTGNYANGQYANMTNYPFGPIRFVTKQPQGNGFAAYIIGTNLCNNTSSYTVTFSMPQTVLPAGLLSMTVLFESRTLPVSCSAGTCSFTDTWNAFDVHVYETGGAAPISPCLKCFVEEKPNDEDRTYLAPSPHSLGHLSNSSADTRPQGTEPASYERLRDVPDSSAVQH